MGTSREFKESPWYQGEDEIRSYEVDTTPWGGYSSGAVSVLKDKDGNVVTTTYMTGSDSAVGNVITTKQVRVLVTGVSPYRLEVQWVLDGDTLEAWGTINWER